MITRMHPTKCLIKGPKGYATSPSSYLVQVEAELEKAAVLEAAPAAKIKAAQKATQRLFPCPSKIFLRRRDDQLHRFRKPAVASLK